MVAHKFCIFSLTFPNVSVRLKVAMRRTGIHDCSLQLRISEMIPGKRQRVTK